MAHQEFSWTIVAKEKRGKLVLHCDTDAPFRAQRGQICVYKGSEWPSNPEEDREAWGWDNEKTPLWETGLPWGQDWYCAWTAQASPDGPYVYIVQLVTTGDFDPDSKESR
jgi:hypothetical protein